MNTRVLSRHSLSILLIACAAISVLLSACQTATAPTSVLPAAATLPAQPPAAEATQPPAAEPTQPAAATTGEISLDLAGVAQNQTVETVAAVGADANAFWTAILPEHHRVTFEGYPVDKHSFKPQILVLPVADLSETSQAQGQKIAADLQALLKSQQPGEEMPYLPMINAKQIIHAQVKYLDFKNGSGVRYLTQFNTGIVKINNDQLVYTYQGLTRDGKYYVAAVLPVTHPELPATQQVYSENADELKNYVPYLAETATWLNQQPTAAFTPDLSKLDAMMQSIEVK